MVVVVAVPMWDVEKKNKCSEWRKRESARMEREMGSSNFPSTKFFFYGGKCGGAGGKLFRGGEEGKVWFSFEAIKVGPNCEIRGSVPAALLWESALLRYF